MRREEHYQGKYECREILEYLLEESDNDRVLDHYRTHAIKYLWRCGKKDDPLKEIKKAITFLQFAVDYMEAKEAPKKKVTKKND